MLNIFSNVFQCISHGNNWCNWTSFFFYNFLLSWTTFLHVDIRQQWNRCISTVVTWMNKIFQVLVAKSPVAPFTAFNYTIQKDGIVQEGKYKFSCLLLKIWQVWEITLLQCINLGKFQKISLRSHGFFLILEEGARLYAGTDPGVQQINVRTSLPFYNTWSRLWEYKWPDS